MCRYCESPKAKTWQGVTLNDKTFETDDVRLSIVYGDYSDDEKEHYYISSESNHIDASIEINYCPICGRKL